MADQKLLTQTLSEFASTLVRDFSVSDVLPDLAERAAAVVRADSAGVSLPTLMNAGTSLGLLSGCVVLPVEDSLESIFRALGQAALLHQAGGSTGYSFSRLRPRGDVVASTGGAASGPVSFLPVFNTAARVLARAPGGAVPR